MSSFIRSGDTITIIAGGRQFAVQTSHPNFIPIKEGLSTLSDEDLITLIDIPLAVRNFTAGKAEVVDGQVLYNGEAIHNVLTEKILALMSDGFPFDPMLRFMENLYQNPSAASVKELYEFLEHRGLPITEDGYFLAYKVVRPDFMDKFSGKIDNHPGQVIEFERRNVDDNRHQTCSFGLHVGCLDYIKWYGCQGDVVLIVKVNPKDAVSVPTDHNATKLRVCKYEVLSVYEGPVLEELRELPDSLYRGDGSEYYDDGDDDSDDDKPRYIPCDDCDAGVDCEDCDYYHC